MSSRLSPSPDLTSSVHAIDCDEASPLLAEGRALEAQHKSSAVMATPVPKAALFALCAVRIVDPIAFSQIFPWVNQFMDDLHVTDDPSQIGFYSGLVESAFAISQLISIYHWARVSDVIGRRPCLLFGTTGIAFATLAFGLSQSLTRAIVARFLSGFFSGNIAVLHSILGEMTDSTNQGVVFPIYGLFWPLGNVIGPLLGGTFANAATKYPHLFDYSLLRRFPYLPPCFIVAVIALFGVASGYLFLEETLPSKRHYKVQESTKPHDDTVGHETSSTIPDVSLSLKQLLALPIVRALCKSGFALSFISCSYEVVFVLFCYSPIQRGGIAFSVSEIGYSLATAGIVSAGLQVVLMPYLLRTYSSVKIYNFAMSMWWLPFVCLPLINLIARAGYDPSTGTVGTSTLAILWVCLAGTMLTARFGHLAYSVSMIMVKENAHPSSLSTTNGLVQMCMCLSRAVAPAFVSSNFALSIKFNLLGGYAWVVVMLFICWRGSLITKNIAVVQSNSPSRI